MLLHWILPHAGTHPLCIIAKPLLLPKASLRHSQLVIYIAVQYIPGSCPRVWLDSAVSIKRRQNDGDALKMMMITDQAALLYDSLSRMHP